MSTNEQDIGPLAWKDSADRTLSPGGIGEDNRDDHRFSAYPDFGFFLLFGAAVSVALVGVIWIVGLFVQVHAG